MTDSPGPVSLQHSTNGSYLFAPRDTRGHHTPKTSRSFLLTPTFLLSGLLGCFPEPAAMVNVRIPRIFPGSPRSGPPNNLVSQSISPPIYPPGHIEDENISAAKARNILRASELLRQKYQLDIAIFVNRDHLDPERRRQQRKSDDILREVHRNVVHWRSSTEVKWTAEEWNVLEDIFRIVEEQMYGTSV